MNYSRRSDNTHCLLAAAIAFASTLPTLQARAAPTGGVVTAGTGAITQQGTTTTVTQTASPRMVIDWKTFSTSSAESIVFRQPDASAIALNRVTGTSPSQLMGSLSANGQVFILNPNGVLFGPGAQVDVRGLLASTLGMDNASFLRGSHVLEGNGVGTVVNQGRLTAADGGYIALVGPSVTNSGAISARLGDAVLLAGDKVTVRLEGGSLAGYTIDRGSADALVNNSASGAISASGGRVVLAADAADVLGRAVVNHDGLIEAQTLNRVEGSIRLLADARVGQLKVGGKLDATAPGEGNGGQIETSGAYVRIEDSAAIDTRSANGKAGSVLIDPVDFEIIAGDSNPTSSSIGADRLGVVLDGANVTISTSFPGTSQGDISVNADVTWGANKLTLQADRNINFNASLTGGSVSLFYGQGSATGGTADFVFNNGAKINLTGPSGTFTTRKGSASQEKNYTIVRGLGLAGSNDPAALQGISSPGINDNYVLGTDINAGATLGWNSSAGFIPLAQLFGTVDGLGHTIDGLVMNSTANVGLFSSIASSGQVRNLGLSNALITGTDAVGGIAGVNSGEIIRSYVNGEVHGLLRTGGLVGQNENRIANSYSGAIVTGREVTGGLVGENRSGIIGQSYATGKVEVVDPAENILSASGGLVGFNRSFILNSYATGNASGNTGVGGLIGSNLGTVQDSYATGNVSGRAWIGGLAGAAEKGSTVNGTYAAGAVTGTDATTTGGLVGALAPSGGAGAAPIVSNSYWKIASPGAGGQSPAGTGKTNAELMQAATFSGWDLSANGGAQTVWRIYEGNTMPLLRSFLAPLALGAAVTPEYNGVAQSNAAIPVTGTRTYTAASGTNAGTYQAFSNQQGYDLSGGDLAINKRALVISATADNKVYNGDTAAVATFKADRLVQGDDVVIGGKVAFADKNVGLNKATTVSSLAITGAQAGNYSFNPQVASNSASITKAELTIDVTPISKTYDSTKKADLTLSDNRAAGDKLNLALTGDFNTKDVGNGKSVTVTGIAVSGEDAANYTYRPTVNNTADITPALLKIDVTPNSKTYDGTAAASLVVGDNRIGADVLNLTLTGAFDDKNVGEKKQVQVTSLKVEGQDAKNYTYQTEVLRVADITPRPLNISASAADRVYDGTTQAIATLSNDRIGGDLITIGYGAASFDNKNAGVGKKVTVSGIVASGADAGNYRVQSQALTSARITPRALGIAATAADRAYDGTTQAAATLTNDRIAGDALTLAYGAANFDNKNTGMGKQVTVSGIAVTGTDAGNYTLQPQVKTAASITPRPLDIVARVDDKVYDGTTRATATTSDNRIAGDVLGMSYQLASFADKEAGQQKSVSLSGVALSGPDAPNYTANGSIATTASITPKNLSIVANADKKLFDGTPYEGGNGVTVSGLVAGETTAVLSGQLAYGGDAQGAVAPGKYSIRPGGLSSANYATMFVEGPLTVAFGDQQPATAIASATSAVLLPPTIARPTTRLSNSTDLRLVDCGIRFPANLLVEGCGPQP